MASATTQLQLMMSKFPEHIRKMPLKKFLKQHCPNTIANTRSDGTVYFDPVLESEPFLIGRFQAPGGGVLNFNSLNFNSLNFNTGFASVQNTPGFGPSKTCTTSSYPYCFTYEYFVYFFDTILFRNTRCPSVYLSKHGWNVNKICGPLCFVRS